MSRDKLLAMAKCQLELHVQRTVAGHQVAGKSVRYRDRRRTDKCILNIDGRQDYDVSFCSCSQNLFRLGLLYNQ